VVDCFVVAGVVFYRCSMHKEVQKMIEKEIPSLYKPIESMLAQLNVNAVFGSPLKEGETSIIPIAEVGFGFGYGSGGEKETKGEDSSGVGGGGGGGGTAKPIGFIKLSPQGAKFEPIVDSGKIAITLFMAIGWWVFWLYQIAKLFAPHKAHPCKCGRGGKCGKCGHQTPNPTNGEKVRT
jgi:uncharacterized spore protein YtfJ